MSTVTLILALLCVSAAFAQTPSLWPQPSGINVGYTNQSIAAYKFQFVASGYTDAVLDAALERYSDLTFWKDDQRQPSGTPTTKLQIVVASGPTALQYGFDESYTLTVPLNNASAFLQANTVWGALRGLETFSQLVEWDSSVGYYVPAAPVSITDAPRFAWRGLMIDTARHYLRVDTILHIIDTMAFSKLNVLHWHAVDAQSFPVVIEQYPNLSGAGAWAKEAVYTNADFDTVVAFAYSRGIRVVIEFDGPGHAYAWGHGYPQLVVSCPDYAANINNIPLNPTLDFTWQVLQAVFSQVTEHFPDEFLHVGGDEVVTGCWGENAQVTQWMAQHNIKTTMDLYAYFELKEHQMVLNLNRTAINWEEVLDNNLGLPTDTTIIHVWKNQSVLGNAVKAGYRALLSAGWYLDQQLPAGPTHYEWEDTWKNFYANDPFNGLTLTDAEKKLVLGGEAAMWGEQVNDFNFDSRVWPRACAAAERLWSPQTVTDVSFATGRLSDMSCRLQRRGVRAGPIEPNWCELP